MRSVVHRIGWSIMLVLLSCLISPCARGQAAGNPLDGVGIDQKLNTTIPGDLLFNDEAGRPVHLEQYFHDKPIILALVYYRCPMLCTVVLNNLLDTLQHLPLNAGREFTVLTVSFDPADTPAGAAAKKKNLLAVYNRPDAEAGWHFLTGTQPNITALTQAVGFRYRWDKPSQQFIHPSGLMILTPEGKISRYFFGIDYQPTDVRLALLDAGREKIAGPTDRILLYCFHYDPYSGKYTLAITNIIRASGVFTLLAIGGLLGMLLLRERKRARRVAASLHGVR